MRVLVLGGTRNLGHDLVLWLLARGHSVTVLNRGQTLDTLPESVERLRADRSRREELAPALGRREWDVAVDLTLYNGADARAAVELLNGRVGHYLFISTGQVYLVLQSAPRPARESDYAGPVMTPPPAGTRDHSNWMYGVGKRAAEDVLAKAWSGQGFPSTSLRLPMVNSRRDHYGRLHGYVLRLLDGGPILIPDRAGPALRHVFGPDVVRVLVGLIESGLGKGEAFNLSQDETVSLIEFLEQVRSAMPGHQRKPRFVALPLAQLEAEGLFPACSPFSDTWMSALDNTRSKVTLGASYTPLAIALPALVRHYLDPALPPPPGYAGRARELELGRMQNPE